MRRGLSMPQLFRLMLQESQPRIDLKTILIAHRTVQLLSGDASLLPGLLLGAPTLWSRYFVVCGPPTACSSANRLCLDGAQLFLPSNSRNGLSVNSKVYDAVRFARAYNVFHHVPTYQYCSYYPGGDCMDRHFNHAHYSPVLRRVPQKIFHTFFLTVR